jgi:hypothetical protein
MNAKQRLQSWVSDWSAHRLLSETPPAAPEPPRPADPAKTGGSYTVGAGGGLAGMLLAQLTSAITPDDAQKAAQAGAFTVSASGVRSPSVPILRGQIRQLNPELNPAWTRTVIVLVLRVDEAAQQALVAPFGQFAQPAFDGELATELDDESLSVLCVWNAATVPFAALRRSWWLTDAFDDLLQNAEALHASRAKREPVPEALKEHVGPPITHPLDPRHDYLDLEAGLLEGLKGGSES